VRAAHGSIVCVYENRGLSIIQWQWSRALLRCVSGDVDIPLVATEIAMRLSGKRRTRSTTRPERIATRKSCVAARDLEQFAGEISSASVSFSARFSSSRAEAIAGAQYLCSIGAND
jgi:hypothetical protein